MNKNKNFQVDKFAIRYSNFAPRLFNYCLSLGMKPNTIMPSRAFCSDENQGYPIILLAKHFATFPFNHGRVGGLVATDRHGPHAHHGKDVVIVQASHVGYNPENKQFGEYRRLQTHEHSMSSDCGAICGLLNWYEGEYHFASQQILIEKSATEFSISIDNQLLNNSRSEGLFLNLDKLIDGSEVLQRYSTSKVFKANPELIKRLGDSWDGEKTAIGRYLTADMFYYKRGSDTAVASGLLNDNLILSMPSIVCSKAPALEAAKVNVQMEFDRTFRTIVKEETYKGKKMLFISGVHIDISPNEGQLFPLTKFVPWAAYFQDELGNANILEQQEIFDALMDQTTDNPHKIDLTNAIHQMEAVPEVQLQVDEI
ncbi:MAG: hypothetical protein ISR69_08425 [Gammaproteobacteria bacterium]|nr:hypothetical protein [Gammaproteobacteria bacterium]